MRTQHSGIDETVRQLIAGDPLLAPYRAVIKRRLLHTREKENALTLGRMSLSEFAAGHEYFGLHFRDNTWIFREWAPNARAIYLVGVFTDWQQREAFRLERLNEEGIWQIILSPDRLSHGDLYRLRVHWPGGEGDRIPAYTRYVVQDPASLIFNACVRLPPDPYRWRCEPPPFPPAPLLIYEAHVGMAQEEEKVGSYREFTARIIPRIVRAGYTAVQLMAIQEHPYYGSFGYQVSNFFAASSRFGSPEDLKELIDTAHAAGLRVIMDLVHSHAATNEVEGLGRFDGTPYQYFHGGPRGHHEAWDSRCFDYGKNEVLHFLLSNCRFWLDEYRFDGFRFDGVTSMLYRHHGLGRRFLRYEQYYDASVDEDALAYLIMANKLIHDVRPSAVTIAEDVSGMPGLAVPAAHGGAGFDYRFAMGVANYWIQMVSDIPDEDWPTGHLWYELNNRRRDERTISYAESHDQALVGDKTLISRLIDADIYEHMSVDDENLRVERGISLHKLIRLITLATAGHGYLNFMGNEFGHPEWIDFPTERNGWSYKFARRQWHLSDDSSLKYHALGRFDRDMITLAARFLLLGAEPPSLLWESASDKVIAFARAGLVFAFNFHPTQSHVAYPFPASPGRYAMILDSDAKIYAGRGRLQPDQHHFTLPDEGGGTAKHLLRLYLPTRTAVVLQRLMD